MTAILIGFQYSLGQGDDFVPGIKLDLYHAWKHCQRSGLQPIIISDIRSDLLRSNGFARAVASGVVDIEIVNFMSSTNDYRLVHDKEEMLQNLNEIARSIPQQKRLFIYYTGHGAPGAFIMPDRSQLSVGIFLESILKLCQSDAEIFTVLDCCNPDDMGFPYTLRGLEINDQSEKRFRWNGQKTKRRYLTQKMLLLTSATESEKSYSFRSGSCFTRALFRAFQQSREKSVVKGTSPKPSPVRVESHLLDLADSNLRYLPSLINYIQRDIAQVYTRDRQTVSIYAAQPVIPLIWSWVIGTFVELDIAQQTVVLNKEPDTTQPYIITERSDVCFGNYSLNHQSPI
jgi:hypothetical protein